MSREDYPQGTIVFIRDLEGPLFGVVVDREFWMDKAFMNSPWDYQSFQDGEKDYGEGSMIPILVFGEVIREDLRGHDCPRYIKKYATCKHGGDVTKLDGGHMELRDLIKYINVFSNSSIDYIKSVEKDLGSYEIYCSEDYDLDGDDINWMQRRRIMLFEKALA